MQEPTEKQHGNGWLCRGAVYMDDRNVKQLLVSDGRNS